MSALVSVVIPVHQNVRHLADAVRSALDQSHRPVEVVAVDDGSTDRSAQVLHRFGSRIRTVRQDNQGAASARNRGIAEAHGGYLAFLDADDLYPPDRCEVAVTVLEARPEIDAVVGRVDEFISEEVHDRTAAGLRPPRRGVTARLPGTLTVRRTAFDRVGPFDSALAGGEAVDWFVRASAAGLAIEWSDRVMLRRRLHATNASLTDPAALHQQYLQAAIKALRSGRERRA